MYKKLMLLTLTNPNFMAAEGTPFDAVVSALDHFEIPALVTEVTPIEVISVLLSNGDSALFVNGDAVYQLDVSDSGQSPAALGEVLTNALGIELQSVTMDVPTDSDWNWNDVYELLPCIHGEVARGTVL